MTRNIAIVVGVVGIVAVAAWLRSGGRADAGRPDAGRTEGGAPAPGAGTVLPTSQGAMPMLVELGAGACVACRQMAPIIEELRREYAGRAIVESIDVMKHADRARVFGWRVIPAQVFLNADGDEVWRHEGYLAKARITAILDDLIAGKVPKLPADGDEPS